MSEPVSQPEEQLLYARLLAAGSRLGLVLLVLSFGVYLTGWLQPHVPLEQLPQLWQHPAHRFRDLAGMPAGWGWLALVHRADIAGLAGIAVLAGCSLPALLALVPVFLRRGERAAAVLSAAVAVVVLLAASGLMSQGHG